MNEVKVFYEAMEIFARKHYGQSKIFLLLLKSGIWLRSLIAYFSKSGLTAAVVSIDILILNTALLLATAVRFSNVFAFPAFAYPAVFFVVTFVFVMSMLMVEGYSDRKFPIRKVISGLMVSFFVLSSFTYFFKEYAFSRGVLLMTIGFTLIGSVLVRWILGLSESIKNQVSTRRIGIVGINENSEKIISEITKCEAKDTIIVGIIEVESDRNFERFKDISIIGNYEYLLKLIADYQLSEIIISDVNISKAMMPVVLLSLDVKLHPIENS